MSAKVPKTSSKSKQPAGAQEPPKCRYIRSLTLKNVRTFRSEAKLDLCFPDGRLAQWTIILGENGTGKTTLLQYIAAMAPIQDTTGPPVPIEGSPNGRYLFRPFMASAEHIFWHWANLSHPHDLPKHLVARVYLSQPASSLESAIEAKRFKHEGKPVSEGDYGFDFSFAQGDDNRPRVKITSVQHAEESFLEEFALYSYGANRHVASPSSPYLTSDAFQQSSINTLFNDEVPLVSPEQWLLGLDHQSKGDAPHHRLMAEALRRSKECLCQVLPDVSGIKIAPSGTPQSGMTVFFETPYGPVRFSGLSLGYRAMASWIIDFVRKMHLRYPHLPEPEKGPAVVLIDEFDLHMHVRWQMEMMEWLTRSFPNTQFIISAHSPLVVQAADGKANIAVLKRVKGADGKDEVIIENDPLHVRGWRLDQLVASDLYGLESSRSKTYSDLMAQRTRLMQKESLSKDEQVTLADLNERLYREAPPDMTPAQEWLEQQLRSATKQSKRKTRK